MDNQEKTEMGIYMIWLTTKAMEGEKRVWIDNESELLQDIASTYSYII